MDRIFEQGYYQLPKERIGLLRFLLESYDGLMNLRTLDSRQGVVELSWPPSRVRDARALIDALTIELGLRPVPRPEVVPPL